MLLAKLKEALKPITQISRAEVVVELAETKITIRLLTPDEELECQRQAQHFLEDLGDDDEETEDLSRTRALRFLDAFRTGILSRAIVQVNDLDLREVYYIETGEKLDNGTMVKVTRIQALHDLVSSWPRPVQVRLMEEFQTLTEAVNRLVRENTSDEYASEEAEIADMKEQIKEKESAIKQKQNVGDEQIRKAMRTVAKQEESFVSERMNTAKDIEERLEKVRKEEEAPSQEPIQVQQNKVRQPIYPSKAAPPQPATQQEEPTEPTPQKSSPKEPSQRKDTKKAAPNVFQEQEMPSKKIKPSGLQDGIEVYRLPTQTLGGSPKPTNVPAQSSRNPRFKSPKN